MKNFRIERSTLVRAKLTSITAGSKAFFDTDNDLNSRPVEVLAIEAFTAAEFAINEQGETVIPAAAKADVSVTLVNDRGDEFVQSVPLTALMRNQNNGFLFKLSGQMIQIRKCYVKVNLATNLTANQVVQFNIYTR